MYVRTDTNSRQGHSIHMNDWKSPSFGLQRSILEAFEIRRSRMTDARNKPSLSTCKLTTSFQTGTSSCTLPSPVCPCCSSIFSTIWQRRTARGL